MKSVKESMAESRTSRKKPVKKASTASKTKSSARVAGNLGAGEGKMSEVEKKANAKRTKTKLKSNIKADKAAAAKKARLAKVAKAGKFARAGNIAGAGVLAAQAGKLLAQKTKAGERAAGGRKKPSAANTADANKQGQEYADRVLGKKK